MFDTKSGLQELNGAGKTGDGDMESFTWLRTTDATLFKARSAIWQSQMIRQTAFKIGYGIKQEYTKLLISAQT